MGTGGETNHLESVNSVYVYDPQADAWMQLANMGNARRFHASAAVGGKLYVFGFGAASGLLCTAEVYGPASDSWAQVSSLTTVRNSMVAIAL
jgi:N-acetylneuraminic acid mutarotase